MRKYFVAGNWKMNKTPDEAKALAKEVSDLVDAQIDHEVDVVLCPPFVDISNTVSAVSSKVKVGAQNCHSEESGAYTGEVSVPMLKNAGVEFVIIGHSERREHFQESNEFLKQKTDAIFAQGLIPIFCCGETLEQRNEEIHIDFVKKQIEESLFHLEADIMKKVVIAYEPIWAIGTGVTASTEQAQEMHEVLRSHIESKYGNDVSEAVRILYGGSMKPGNAEELLACKDVDGGLIGGASLKPQDFIDIIKHAK
jgi:triosephosphate isomerase